MKKLNLDFTNKTYSIVEKRKIWFIIPVIILLIASIVFTIFAIINKNFASGINAGLDFTGGTIMTIPLDDNLEANYNSYYDKIEEIFANKDSTIGNTQISENSIVIRYKNIFEDEDEMDALNAELKLAIENAFPNIYTNGETAQGEYIQIEFIGATASRELIVSAVVAVSVTLVLILLYIIFRFEWVSGVAAIIALTHDAIMIMALTILFRVQINSSFVIAIVTVVAYSINNSIIIFDRIRDEMKMQLKNPNSKIDVAFVVNDSVTKTLARTILTSTTTMIMVVLLALVNVSTLREFALPLLFGMMSAIFSANCIAPSIYTIIKTKRMEINMRNAQQNKPVYNANESKKPISKTTQRKARVIK